MKDFKKYFKIKASVTDVYNALTNEQMIEIWTGDKALMKPEENTRFELYDGSISGTNIEFIPNKKIVQEWDFGDEETISVVTILLHENKGNTSLELRHTNIPDDAYENIAAGWEEDYMAAIQALFNE